MEAGGERRDDHGRPIAGTREIEADLMIMGITGQEHAGRPKGPVGVEDRDKGLTALLMCDLHPASCYRLAWAQGRARGRKSETDETGHECVLGPETLQTNRIQSVQVAATPRIPDAALGHQEILPSTKHGHACGAKEDDMHHARSQEIIGCRVERVRAGPLSDAIQPSHIIVRLCVTKASRWTNRAGGDLMQQVSGLGMPAHVGRQELAERIIPAGPRAVVEVAGRMAAEAPRLGDKNLMRSAHPEVGFDLT